jgi:hypothetical protein
VGLLYQFCAWRENILYCNIFWRRVYMTFIFLKTPRFSVL